MNLITRDELGEYMGTTVIEDSIADQTITHVSNRMARWCDRDDWGENTERTEYLDGGTQYLPCRVWPITAISTIHNDLDHTFGDDTLIDSDDYFIAPDPEGNGYIRLKYRPIYSPWSIKVVYTGGYASVSAIPSDLKTAALMQCKVEARQQQTARANDVDTQWLYDVQQILKLYKRAKYFA